MIGSQEGGESCCNQRAREEECTPDPERIIILIIGTKETDGMLRHSIYFDYEKVTRGGIDEA
jgi:hypothetical protein